MDSNHATPIKSGISGFKVVSKADTGFKRPSVTSAVHHVNNLVATPMPASLSI